MAADMLTPSMPCAVASCRFDQRVLGPMIGTSSTLIGRQPHHSSSTGPAGGSSAGRVDDVAWCASTAQDLGFASATTGSAMTASGTRFLIGVIVRR